MRTCPSPCFAVTSKIVNCVTSNKEGETFRIRFPSFVYYSASSMAPKKEAGGPTPADIEAEWQQKVAQWEREERQLQLAVRSQQGDTAHYQKTLQTMNSEVQSLAKTSQQLVKRNTEQRMQYKRQERQWSELEAKELTTQEEQARLVANLNEQIQKSRTDLSVMNGSFETEAASTAHKVAAVRFRQSAIAALREKVVKLRTERTRAIAELDSLQHLLEETQNSFRWDGGARSVLHAVLVHDRVPALQRLSNLLCHRLGYDVTVCHTQRSAASAEEISFLSKADSSNGREASELDGPVRLSSVEGRQLARLEAAFAPKIRTIDLQRLPRGSDLSDVPASAHVAVTLSSLLRQVGRSVGTNDDDVRLVLLSAQENPDDAGDESDADAVPLALCFPVPAGPALSADNDLQLQHDKETTSLLQRPVVFSTEDVLRVLTGESVQKNSLVILEIAKAHERGSCVMIAVPSPPGSQDDEHVFVLHRAPPVNDGRTAGGESASVVTALHSSHSAVLLTEVLERIADDINYLGSACPSVQQLAGNLFTAFVSTGEYRHTTPPLWLMDSVRGGDTPALLSAVTGEPTLPCPAVGAVLREGALQESRVSARISLFVGGPSSLHSGRSALAWLLQKGKSVDSTFDASILPAVERSLPTLWDETLQTERYILVRGANVAAAAVVQAVSLVLRHAYRMMYTAAVEGDSQELSGPPIDVSVACERGTSWCVLRLAVRTGNAQRATTLHEAMQIAPGTLYGRHRAAALRASKESLLNSSNSNNKNNNSTTSSSQVLQILEANLPAALPQSDEVVVRSVAHVSLQSSVTKRQVLPLYDTLFSHSSQLDEQDGPQGVAIVVVDSAEEVRSFAPLRSLTVANSLRRHELSLDPFSLASQQLLLLVIHPTIDLSRTAGLWWEQYDALCSAESTLRGQVPAAWLHAAVIASLSLRELNHQESSSQQQHVDSPASDGASPTSSSSSAALRVIVQCLPPNILSFLTTCTYPCVLVTSCYLGNTARGSQGLVLPRNLSSTRRSADPTRLSDTVFSAADLARGIAYFYRHILCVSQETLREGGNLNDEEGEESLPPSFIKL